jgi:hypothetical protein
MCDMKCTKINFILMTVILLSCFLLGCNEGSSDSDNTKSLDAETTWYRDADVDGYGDSSATLTQSDQPEGYVNISGDCADYDSDIFPGALELCDGKDNNCSGGIDENACGPQGQKISGRISNFSDVQAYVTEDSYLQLVSYPADGQMPFTTDGQGRRVYTSDLATTDMLSNGAFVFETLGLISGQYVIAAQSLDPYGPGSEEEPVLSDEMNQALIFSVPADNNTVFEVELGSVRLPVPVFINKLQSGSAPPDGVRVSASDGDFEDKIRVIWEESAGATSYEVYRADSFAGQKVKIATTTAASYDDVSLPCGVEYYYGVKAVNASGASDLFYDDLGYIRCPLPEPQPVVDDVVDDVVDEGVVDEAPLEDPADMPISLHTPTGTMASNGAYPDKIRITWNAVSLAASYDIYRAVGDCCGAKIKIGSSYDTFYDDFDVKSGDYYYWIKAINESGTSEFGLPDRGHIMTRPFAPTGVKASDGTYLNKVLVTWDKSPTATYFAQSPCCPQLSDKIPITTSYEIYRVLVSGTPILIGKTSALQFFDTDLDCSKCCRGGGPLYSVKAVNAAGSSGFSHEDKGWVYQTLCDPDVTASDGLRNCVWVSWETVAGADKYKVYRSDSEGGIKALMCTVKTGGCYIYRDSTTTCPKVYYYWVKAIDAKGYTSCTFGDYDTGYCSDE